MNDDISRQIAEFEARGGKIKEVAPGETAPFKTISKKARELQAKLRAKGESFTEPAYIRRNKERPKSGYNNIKIQKTTIAVYLGHGVHKTFPKGDDEAAALKAALECRDKCRAAMGLPPAEF